jgi:DNA-binding NarL/FixJ family response regulator
MRDKVTSTIRVLIAHGDPLIAAGLAATLQTRPDFAAVLCSPALAVARAASGHLPSTDVVIADYDLGLRWLVAARAQSPRVIVLTHTDSEAGICHALNQGASGYLLLGCSQQELLAALRSVHLGRVALAPLAASRVAERMKQQPLTAREADILRQMMLGLSNKAIAGSVAISVGTVKVHVKTVLRKLQAKSRTEAVAIAQRRGILLEESASNSASGTSTARKCGPAMIRSSDAIRKATRRFATMIPESSAI